MKHALLASVLLLSAASASAEVKSSARNLEPLTQRPGAARAAARSGNAGLSVATPQSSTPRETVAKVTFLGPTNGWGFVQATCPYYTPQGKREGTLPGGTLFKYTDVKASSKNAMLVCSVKRGEAWAGPFLLDCTTVAAYEGGPDTLDPDTLGNLESYFILTGKIAERRAAIADEALAANPHFETARQAQQAYHDSIAKAAEMEKTMNTLTGPRKAKADEALRALKYEQVRIKAKADDEARAYKTWKEAHPADPAKLAADPQLQALEQALQATRAKVGALVPPAS